MSKLPSFTPRKLITLLERYGFVIDHVSGSHYILYNEVRHVRVVVPYHGKDMPRGTLLTIIKSSGLDISFFEK